MKEVILTPEQKEQYKNYYFIGKEMMISLLGDSSELTCENFKAFAVVEGILQELTVEDFKYYDPKTGDKDFIYYENDRYKFYVNRNNMPKEVRNFLDAVIQERMAAEE